MSIESLGVIVGSFDPLHRGHQWMVRQMRQRFELVLLLVPTVHFHKRVHPARNATLDQRVTLIHRVYAGQPVAAGVTDEVLFLRLVQHLSRCFPGAAVGLGLGTDAYHRLLQSPRYFRRLGLPQLAREPLISFGPGSFTRRRVMQVLQRHGASVQVEVDGKAAALRYVALGVGIAFLSMVSGQRPESSGVVLRDVSHLFPRADFWLLWREGRQPGPVEQLLIAELERAVKDRGA